MSSHFTFLLHMLYLKFIVVKCRGEAWSHVLCSGAFWLYSGFALIGLIVFTLCLPETKGKQLEEVEQLFSEPLISCRHCCNGAYSRMAER